MNKLKLVFTNQNFWKKYFRFRYRFRFQKIHRFFQFSIPINCLSSSIYPNRCLAEGLLISKRLVQDDAMLEKNFSFQATSKTNCEGDYFLAQQRRHDCKKD